MQRFFNFKGSVPKFLSLITDLLHSKYILCVKCLRLDFNTMTHGSVMSSTSEAVIIIVFSFITFCTCLWLCTVVMF